MEHLFYVLQHIKCSLKILFCHLEHLWSWWFTRGREVKSHRQMWNEYWRSAVVKLKKKKLVGEWEMIKSYWATSRNLVNMVWGSKTSDQKQFDKIDKRIWVPRRKARYTQKIQRDVMDNSTDHRNLEDGLLENNINWKEIAGWRHFGEEMAAEVLFYEQEEYVK